MRRVTALIGALLLAPALARAPFSLSSPAFSEGHTIPEAYTCQGLDASPPLRWSAPPAGTQELAVVCLDPDAPSGVFVHWVIAGLPPGLQQLHTGEKGYVQGHNDFGAVGYRGPCPPKGKPHHYRFELLALDTHLGLTRGVTWQTLEKASTGHVLARARLSALFGR